MIIERLWKFASFSESKFLICWKFKSAGNFKCSLKMVAGNAKMMFNVL